MPFYIYLFLKFPSTFLTSIHFNVLKHNLWLTINYLQSFSGNKSNIQWPTTLKLDNIMVLNYIYFMDI